MKHIMKSSAHKASTWQPKPFEARHGFKRFGDSNEREINA